MRTSRGVSSRRRARSSRRREIRAAAATALAADDKQRETLRRSVAEQPTALVVERACLEREIGPIKHHRACREQRRINVASGVRIEPRDDRIVRVAEGGNVAAHIHDARDELQHRFQALPVFGAEVASVRARDEAGDEHHVRHFVVIPDGLLAIDAVAAVLQQRLLLQLAQRLFAPGLRLRPASATWSRAPSSPVNSPSR